MAKEITLQDVKDAFAAGRAKTETYRGQGKTDVVVKYNSVEEFFNAKGKSHLKAKHKAELKAAAAEAKKQEELAEKKRKAAEEAANNIEE